jgi:hypothetical protein
MGKGLGVSEQGSSTLSIGARIQKARSVTGQVDNLRHLNLRPYPFS